MDNIVSDRNAEPKPVENLDNNSSQQSLQFAHHHAFIIGVDNYLKVSPLATAVNDAKKIANVLRYQHHF